MDQFPQTGYFHFNDGYPSDTDNLIFYPEGTFCYNVNISRDSNNKKKFKLISQGVYDIDGDTIRANYYEEYSYLHIWYLTKMEYVILDDLHIKCISKEFLGTDKNGDGFPPLA